MLLTSPALNGTTPSMADNNYVPNQALTGRTYLPLSNDTCSTSTNPAYKCFMEKNGCCRNSAHYI